MKIQTESKTKMKIENSNTTLIIFASAFILVGLGILLKISVLSFFPFWLGLFLVVPASYVIIIGRSVSILFDKGSNRIIVKKKSFVSKIRKEYPISEVDHLELRSAEIVNSEGSYPYYDIILKFRNNDEIKLNESVNYPAIYVNSSDFNKFYRDPAQIIADFLNIEVVEINIKPQ